MGQNPPAAVRGSAAGCRSVHVRVAHSGVLAMDVCDLSWGAARADQPILGRVGDDWALVTEFSLPSPDRYVREMTTFVRAEDGTWRRDHERHDNVLVDTATIPALLAPHGLDGRVGGAFGSEQLPVGPDTVIGQCRGLRAAGTRAPRAVRSAGGAIALSAGAGGAVQLTRGPTTSG